MKCRHIRKMISQYLDDELGLDDRKDFSLHIRSCASCREVFEETKALHQLFASAHRFTVPYGFATRVLGNLEEKKESRLRSHLSVRPFILRAAQVTFAIIVMTIGIILGSLLLPEKTGSVVHSAVQESFSLDLFQVMPADSIGGIYNNLMRPNHEK